MLQEATGEPTARPGGPIAQPRGPLAAPSTSGGILHVCRWPARKPTPNRNCCAGGFASRDFERPRGLNDAETAHAPME
jgi:hypothetical protein